MNFASVKNSPRLQRVLAFLRRAQGWVSTRDIIQGAEVCAVNSCIAELRGNGFNISCHNQSRGVFVYKLEEKQLTEVV